MRALFIIPAVMFGLAGWGLYLRHAARPSVEATTEEEAVALPVRAVDAAALDALLKKGGVVVIDFHAVWCGPCRSLAPRFDAWAAKHGDRAEFVKVDTDSEPALTRRYGVRAIPAVFVQRGGKKVRLSSHAEEALLRAITEVKD